MTRKIGEFLVDSDIFSTQFACDLIGCKGACCVMPGGAGAPVAESEVADLTAAAAPASAYLSSGKQSVLAEVGPLEGPVGDRTTVCIEDQDCLFVYYEGEDGIAKCAIERAFLEGKTSFRKPLSCHLYPIRIDKLLRGERLRYEEIEECEPGRKRGVTEQIDLVRFLEEPLVRAYGRPFYDELVARIKR